MKILLAVDGSEFSETAAKSLIAQVAPQKAEITVLHVVELPLADFQGGMRSVEAFEALRKDQLELGRQLAAQFEKQLKEAGFKAKSAVEEGDARSGILDFASKWKADLIFMGSHGRRGWKRLMLGSVPDAVARHAHCSVEIVRVPQQKASAKQRSKSR